MISIAVPLLVCLVGLLIYAFAGPKLSAPGLIAFAVGLFFVVSAVSGATWHLR